MIRWYARVLVSIALLAPVHAAAGSRCAATKARATATRMQRGGRCRAAGVRKGVPPKPACLAGATKGLARSFGRAERRGDCPTEVTADTIDLTVAGFLANVATSLPPGDTPSSRRCSAAKLVATARRAGAMLRCDAEGIRADAPASATCLEKAVRRFDRMIAHADERYACADATPGVLLAGTADALVSAVMTALDPLPPTGTTSTSTSTSSTTTSSPPTTSSSTTTTTTTVTTSTTKPGGSSTSLPGPTSSTSTSTSSTLVTTTSTSVATTSSTTSTSIPGTVSFAADIQPILSGTCAVAGCHSGVLPAQDMNLEAGQAYTNLVGVASGECPLFPRVAPGVPSGSYLLFKLAGPPQPCFSGNQMPSGGKPPLSTEQQATIAAWIAAGAPDN